ncbi:MAG: alpha/beta fold hydrolase [Pseudomonadota bacterium]
MPTAIINGAELYFETHGSGEPLLLIHGLGSSHLDWEFQVPDFARHFQVITVALRGFGPSDRTQGPFTVEQHASDIAALLDHLKLRKTHLLGYSMGGAIAFQLAVDFPNRLRSLVVVNSQPSFELDHWRKHMMVITRIGMAKLMGMQRMARYVAKRIFPGPHQAHLRETMRERHGGNCRTVYLATLRALAGWTVADRIGEIRVPTLVLAGADDLSPVEEKRRFTDSMPNAVCRIIANSGHGTPFDQTRELNAAVLDFLTGLPKPASRERRRRVAVPPGTGIAPLADPRPATG